MPVHPCQANQGLPILEAHLIPVEHNGRTIPIVLRVISIEKSIPEALLFGAPSVQLRLRMRVHFLQPAPFNASADGGPGLCQKVKGVIMRTTRNRLLQIFESIHPDW
jgi:hypothetical protein